MNRNIGQGADDSPENIFDLSFPKGEDSFPVLKAFQEFLDAERERARRRQMVLAIAFMSAIVVIVVLFSVLGVILFSGMVRRGDAKQDKLLQMLLAERTRPETPAVVTPPAPQRDPVVDEMMELLRDLQAETAALKAAAQQPPAAPVELDPPPDVSAKPDAPPRRTGVFSSPRRRPPAEESGGRPASDPQAGASKAPDDPAPPERDADAKAEEDPLHKPEEPSPDERATRPDEADASGKSGDDGVMQVRIVHSRDMRPPAGCEAAMIDVVTENNVRYPWRILVPAAGAAQAKDEAE